MSYRFGDKFASRIRTDSVLILILLAICQQTFVTNNIAVCTVKKKTPVDGQGNCPKYVEFYSKNKFEELLHIVGFIIRIVCLDYHIMCHLHTCINTSSIMGLGGRR